MLFVYEKGTLSVLYTLKTIIIIIFIIIFTVHVYIHYDVITLRIKFDIKLDK